MHRSIYLKFSTQWVRHCTSGDLYLDPITSKWLNRLYLPLAVDDFLEIGTEQTGPASADSAFFPSWNEKMSTSFRAE